MKQHEGNFCSHFQSNRKHRITNDINIEEWSLINDACKTISSLEIIINTLSFKNVQLIMPNSPSASYKKAQFNFRLFCTGNDSKVNFLKKKKEKRLTESYCIVVFIYKVR